MKKYINTEKLIALINAKLENLGIIGRDILQELKNDILSLQQEQPNDLASLISEATSVAKRIVDRDSFYNSLPQNLRDKYTSEAWCEILEALSTIKMQEQSEVDYTEELKKCKDNPLYFFDKYVKAKQKPAEWNESDKEMLKHIIIDIESLKEQLYCKPLCDEEIDWLKHLPERFNLQPKQKSND